MEEQSRVLKISSYHCCVSLKKKKEHPMLKYILPRGNRQLRGSWCIAQEVQPVLCDHAGGWDGVGSSRKVHEGGDVCIPVTDSCGCTAEISATL